MELSSSYFDSEKNDWDVCEETIETFPYESLDNPKSPPIDVEDSDSNFHLTEEVNPSTDEVDIDSECPLNLLSELEATPADDSSRKAKKRFRKRNVELNEDGDDNEKRFRKEIEDDGLDDGGVDEDDEMKKIKTKFKQGCDCEDSNCFEQLDPRSVYRHRLNITELTKAEHDMYLMGLVKACINCNQTSKNKERQRLRAHYFYQGRKVCLTAFLFLENCTRYQLKRIRWHLSAHGVTPRVHGNHGKRPHNVFSLETYNQASEFLKKYFEKFNVGSGYGRTPLTISSDHTTRKRIHALYSKQCATTSSNDSSSNDAHQSITSSSSRRQGASSDSRHQGSPNDRLMGYSTFLYFIKHQFPHVKFVKPQESCKPGKELMRDKTTKSNTISIENSAQVPITKNESNETITTTSNTLPQEYELVFPSSHELLDVNHQSVGSKMNQGKNLSVLNQIDSELVNAQVPGQLLLTNNSNLLSETGDSQPLKTQMVLSTPNALVNDTKSLGVTNGTPMVLMGSNAYTLGGQPLLYIQIQ